MAQRRAAAASRQPAGKGRAHMESEEEEDMDEILREKAEVDRADPKPPRK